MPRRRRARPTILPTVDSSNTEEMVGRKRHNDVGSILLLFLLYALQGIPLGLSGSVPLILANKKVPYSAQAMFSLCSWPFSLKIIWAPIVDSLHWKRFGLRKSWLVPVQLACGLVMVMCAGKVDDWMGDGDNHGRTPQMFPLTLFFLLLYFLMATQDIAVDGWALTMLSRANVGYASTCNSVGQTFGYNLAYIGLLALNDPATCNTYFRSTSMHTDKGIMDLGDFVQIFGVIIILTTLYVWFFKSEDFVDHGTGWAGSKKDDMLVSGQDVGAWGEVRKLYGELWSITKLKPIRWLVLILFTIKVPFAVTDGATSLKLVEYGVNKEELAALAPLLVVLGLLTPIIIGPYIKTGKRSLSVILWVMPLRMLAGLVYQVTLVLIRSVPSRSEFPAWLHILIAFATSFHAIAMNIQFIACMCFFAQISDPAIGGTYMTLLNTFNNLGSKWPISVCLWLLDMMTTKECRASADSGALNLAGMTCDTGGEACPGTCVTTVDGYDTQFMLCTVVGFVWLILFRKKVMELGTLGQSAWRIQ